MADLKPSTYWMFFAVSKQLRGHVPVVTFLTVLFIAILSGQSCNHTADQSSYVLRPVPLFGGWTISDDCTKTTKAEESSSQRMPTYVRKQTEVAKLEGPRSSQENVLWFGVHVHQPACMDVLKAQRDLTDPVPYCGFRHGHGQGLEKCGEVAAFTKLHLDVEVGVFLPRSVVSESHEHNNMGKTRKHKNNMSRSSKPQFLVALPVCKGRGFRTGKHTNSNHHTMYVSRT